MAGLYEDSFKILARICDSSRSQPMVSAWPDSVKKLGLIALGTWMPVVDAILPVPAGPAAAGFILIGATLCCLNYRVTPLEWGVVIAIGFVLMALLAPSVTPDHSRRNQQRRQLQAKPSAIPPVGEVQ